MLLYSNSVSLIALADQLQKSYLNCSLQACISIKDIFQSSYEMSYFIAYLLCTVANASQFSWSAQPTFRKSRQACCGCLPCEQFALWDLRFL